jgi:LAS seventeen-binding protein 1/2
MPYPSQTLLAGRAINTTQELEFLVEASALTQQQLSAIHALLPSTTSASPSSPSSALGNLHISEKHSQNTNGYPSPRQSPAPPPPATPSYAPGVPQAIATAESIYDFNPTDAGDLALQTRDRIAITEFMNADWAKGRNERTGQEGIFPRSYVNIIDDKGGRGTIPPPRPVYNNDPGYGNLPLEVGQGGGIGQAQGPSKLEQAGKKFGRKLGNAGEFPSHTARPFFPPRRNSKLRVDRSDIRRRRHSWLRDCRWFVMIHARVHAYGIRMGLAIWAACPGWK